MAWGEEIKLKNRKRNIKKEDWKIRTIVEGSHFRGNWRADKGNIKIE